MNLLDIALSSISFLTVREKLLLKENIDSLSNLAVLSMEEISQIVGRFPKRAIWNPNEVVKIAEQGNAIMENLDIHGVTYEDRDYPALLREISDSPYAIYYRGNIGVLSKRCVSVVGTRNVCEPCAKEAYNFAYEAALDGCTVVSGLAYGIDSFVHKGAVESNMSFCTAAVLPCGIDTISPVGNKNLAAKILKMQGCILSEYPPESPGGAWRYVQRDRIIASLSPATVVIQAPSGSGALITADFALDFNRDVMFHESCFCEQAQKIKGKEKGKIPLQYVQDGAPVIKNYKDYVSALKSAPGTHSKNIDVQGLLF